METERYMERELNRFLELDRGTQEGMLEKALIYEYLLTKDELPKGYFTLPSVYKLEDIVRPSVIHSCGDSEGFKTVRVPFAFAMWEDSWRKCYLAEIKNHKGGK